MFGPYRREAQFLIEEGASIEAVDQALVDFGNAMGPLAVGDLAGLDVGWRINKEYRHLQPPGIRQAFVEDHLCELGRFGQKTGAGWYKYDDQRRATPDPIVDELIRKWVAEAGIPQRQISAEEITDRCIYALVNEGARILEEGYALRASDIDIIYLNGYGFPAYPRRSHVVCRYRRPKKSLRAHLRIPSSARRNLEARPAAEASCRAGQDLRPVRQGRRRGDLVFHSRKLQSQSAAVKLFRGSVTSFHSSSRRKDERSSRSCQFADAPRQILSRIL